ncbi:MAG: hypothetical protein M3Y64_08310 [Gemmatimonadota bacterium]|nr:hypothetical protein [Gemmatimonadota bacterium]
MAITAAQAGAQVPVEKTGSVTSDIAAGDKANVERLPRQALTHFEAALRAEPRNYAALWKASGDAIDLGESDANQKRRDSLYSVGVAYARRALEVQPDGADANFTMARALGRTALTVGVRERIKFATEVRMRALKALATDPSHAGAMHVMGVWNAEIMRLNSVARLLAKTLLGGAVFAEANWAAAEKYLLGAVAVDSLRTVHHLDLARVYRDTGRLAEARASYAAAIKSPLIDANDELYKQAATAELRALK